MFASDGNFMARYAQMQAGKGGAAKKAAKASPEKKRKVSSKGVAKEAEKAHAESLKVGLYVKIIGLRSRGELNGKVCEIVGFDEKQGGIWKVRLEDGSGKAFRASNLAHLSDKDAGQKARVMAALHKAGATGAPAVPVVQHNVPGLPPGQPPPPKMPPPDPIPAAEAGRLNNAIAAAAAAAARTNTMMPAPAQTAPTMPTMGMMPMMAAAAGAAAAAAGMPPMVPSMGMPGMGMPMAPMMQMPMQMPGMPMMPHMGMPGMPPPPPTG